MCKGHRNQLHNSTNKCKIATVVSDKKRKGLVTEHIIEVREIVSEKVTPELRSEERVNSNALSEMGG